MLLTAVLVAVDLTGWQCGRIERCASSVPVVSGILDVFVASPGRRVAVTAVIPLLVVVLVGMVGRRTYAPPSRCPTPRCNGPKIYRLVVAISGVATPACRCCGRRMSPPHSTAGGAGGVAATKLVATGAAQVVGVVVCVGSLAIFAYTVVLISTEAVTGRNADTADRDRRMSRMISAKGATIARRVSLVLLAVATVYSAWDWTGPWQQAGRLPGLRGAILISFAAGTVMLLLLALSVAVQRPWAQAGGVATTPENRVAMRGLGGPAIATIAFLVAGGFSAGITYRVAELLGYPVLSQETATVNLVAQQVVASDPARPFQERLAAATAEVPLVVPPSFAWAGAAAAVITVALIVVAVVVALGVRRRLGPLADDIVQARAEEAVGLEPGDERVRRVAIATAIASVTDGVGRVVGRIVVVAGVVLLVALGVYIAGEENWRFVEEPPLATLTAVGTWIMGAFALGIVVLAWRSYKSPALRRTVGILWDIGSFFPRAAHPLAPPSYGERAIPELAQRVTTLTATPTSRVVLSGHSQGSVMVVATVCSCRQKRSSGSTCSPTARLCAGSICVSSPRTSDRTPCAPSMNG